MYSYWKYTYMYIFFFCHTPFQQRRRRHELACLQFARQYSNPHELPAAACVCVCVCVCLCVYVWICVRVCGVCVAIKNCWPTDWLSKDICISYLYRWFCTVSFAYFSCAHVSFHIYWSLLTWSFDIVALDTVSFVLSFLDVTFIHTSWQNRRTSFDHVLCTDKRLYSFILVSFVSLSALL